MRDRRRRTVKELAAAADVFHGTLLRYLNNQREMPIAVFYDVCAALRVDPIDVFARAQRALTGRETEAPSVLRFTEDRARVQPEELGRRIALLVEVLARGRGSRHGFREISPLLLQRGIRFTEREWSALIEGDAVAVPSEEALVAIADVLGTEAGYLLGDVESPEVIRIDSQLEFLREMQAGRVDGLAARTTTDVTPETLRAITSQLKHERHST